MTTQQKLLLKIACVLWIIWGFVHAMAGGLILNGSTTEGIQAIADAVSPESLVMDYPDALGGILNQHAWNLLWAGLVTIIGGLFIWRGNMTAIWVTAMIGGLFDIGYFLFVDLGGYAKFIPGTIMTIVSATAIVLSFWVWFSNRQDH